MKEFLNNKNGIIFYIFIIICVCLFVLTYNTIDMDYWARVLQGEAVLQLGHILYKDPFSYTPTHLWIDHEWGAGVIFAIIQQFFGFYGILILRTVITFLIFLLIFKTINITSEKRSKFFDILYFTTVIFAIPTITQSGLRCHFFTFLFFTLFLYLLENFRKSNNIKYLIFLPIIMLFWCNIHAGSVSGIGLILMYILGEFLNKRPVKYYILAFVVCSLTFFINPYGFDYIKFILMATTMQRPMVTEWISPFAHSSWHFLLLFKILFLVNIAVIIFNLKKIKTDYTKYIILFVCGYLSVRFVKNTPFFIITSMIFLYDDICLLINKIIPNKIYMKLEKNIILIYISIILILLSNGIKNFSSDYLSVQPVNVVDFIKNNDLKGKIVSPFDMGSYIAYKLFPNILIYMDGRYEEVYYKETKDLLDDFFNVRNDVLKILETKPEYIILPVSALVNDYIDTDNYSIIYQDDDNYLYAVKSIIKDKYINIPHQNNIKTDFEINFSYKDNNLTDYTGRKIQFE